MEVVVDAFHMGKFEVTWPEYEAFSGNFHRLAGVEWHKRKEVPRDRTADAVTYPTPRYDVEVPAVLKAMGGEGEGFPVVSVSQFAARQYTKWLSKKTGRFYRLPTEAEWEYACRAGTTTAYSFGDDPSGLDAAGVYFDNSGYDDTDRQGYRRVGQKKPNPWGLYDMHGNVAEWCVDGYAKDWYAQFAGRKVSASDLVNWPTKRYPRVLRGGGWESEAADCRSAARKAGTAELNSFDANLPRSAHWESNGFWVGFRVMSPLKEPAEAEKRRYWNADDPATLEVIRGDREMRELITPAGPPG